MDAHNPPPPTSIRSTSRFTKRPIRSPQVDRYLSRYDKDLTYLARSSRKGQGWMSAVQAPAGRAVRSIGSGGALASESLANWTSWRQQLEACLVPRARVPCLPPAATPSHTTRQGGSNYTSCHSPCVSVQYGLSSRRPTIPDLRAAAYSLPAPPVGSRPGSAVSMPSRSAWPASLLLR